MKLLLAPPGINLEKSIAKDYTFAVLRLGSLTDLTDQDLVSKIDEFTDTVTYLILELREDIINRLDALYISYGIIFWHEPALYAQLGSYMTLKELDPDYPFIVNYQSPLRIYEYMATLNHLVTDLPGPEYSTARSRVESPNGLNNSLHFFETCASIKWECPCL